MEPNALATVLDPDNPQLATYRQQAPELLAVAESLVIASDADLEVAAEYTRSATAAVKAIRGMFKPARDALTAAKRQIDALESNISRGFVAADDLLRAKVTAYRTKRVREAEQERQRQFAEELKRREDEQIAQAARLETMARQTGETHYERAAELVLNQPVRKPSIAAPAPPKTKGISDRIETGVEVFDLKALALAVGEGRVDMLAITANTAWLRREAVQKGNTVQDGDVLFDGVRVTKTPDITVRTR